MKTSVKITLFVFMFLLIAGIFIALHMFNLKHADLSKSKPDYFLTASDLQKEFEKNESAATLKYVKKILEVSGIISTVTNADSSHINIALKTDSEVSNIICTFVSTGEISQLRSGDKLTLRGECSGYLMDVLLNNCAVVSK